MPITSLFVGASRSPARPDIKENKVSEKATKGPPSKAGSPDVTGVTGKSQLGGEGSFVCWKDGPLLPWLCFLLICVEG